MKENGHLTRTTDGVVYGLSRILINANDLRLLTNLSQSFTRLHKVKIKLISYPN